MESFVTVTEGIPRETQQNLLLLRSIRGILRLLKAHLLVLISRRDFTFGLVHPVAGISVSLLHVLLVLLALESHVVLPPHLYTMIDCYPPDISPPLSTNRPIFIQSKTSTPPHILCNAFYHQTQLYYC
jgi:hypothetical protein